VQETGYCVSRPVVHAVENRAQLRKQYLNSFSYGINFCQQKKTSRLKMPDTKLRYGVRINESVLNAWSSFDVYLRDFDIEFIEFKDYLPLQRLNNGTWTGAFGHLQASHVDMIEHVMILTTERMSSFQFTIPTIQGASLVSIPF
jgi:hypothetical protein